MNSRVYKDYIYYLDKIPNCALRVSKSGVLHLVIFNDGKLQHTIASLMIRPNHKDKNRVFKLFYPWPSSDQERFYFSDLKNCLDKIKIISNY